MTTAPGPANVTPERIFETLNAYQKTAALKTAREKGQSVGHVHLRHLNPLPRNLGDVLKRYKHVLVPEMNMGQLVMILRAKFLVDAQGYNKIQGKPFKQSEIEQKIDEILE